MGFIPGSRKSPGVGNGNPPQYSFLGNPMDRGAWQETVHGVSKSRTRLSNNVHVTLNTLDSPNIGFWESTSSRAIAGHKKYIIRCLLTSFSKVFINIYLAVLGLSCGMHTLSCSMWDLVPLTRD